MTEGKRNEKWTGCAEKGLKTEGMSAGYGKRVVAGGVSLSVAPGEVMTLIGCNGAGKSTILKTIAGQLSALAGRVFYLGQDRETLSAAERAKRCAVVLTDRIRPENMTGRDVVEMGRYPYTGRLGILTDADRQKADEAIRFFLAQDVADRPFAELSDGQRQRIKLARAVCQEPEILVLDEPLSFLDLRYRLEVLERIRALAAARHVAVIMSLHELDLARQASDRIACAADGKITRVGPPEEIFGDGYLAQLFGLPSGALDGSTGLLRLPGAGKAPGRDSRECLRGRHRKGAAMQRLITIVGIGSGDPQDLTARARQAILEADRLAGAGRMLDLAEALGCGGVPKLADWRAEAVVRFFTEDDSWEKGCVLVSGDTGFYSGAAGVQTALEAAGFTVRRVAGLSSLQLLCAAFGFSWEKMPVVSLHGCEGDVIGALREHGSVFVLPGSGSDLARLQESLIKADLSDGKLFLGSRLGYPDEKTVCVSPGDLPDDISSPCCLIVQAAVPGTGAISGREESGERRENPAFEEESGEISDEAFIRGRVPMTKAEVRDIVCAKLHLRPGSVLYDVGAGTGSVSVQAALSAPEASVYAIENNPEACGLVSANAKRFGCGNVRLVAGTAPDAFEGLPVPDAAFIGGTGGHLKQILAALLLKNPKVRIVMTFVTPENLAKALTAAVELEAADPEIVQVSVARGKAAGDVHLMVAHNPVTVVTLAGSRRQR